MDAHKSRFAPALAVIRRLNEPATLRRLFEAVVRKRGGSVGTVLRVSGRGWRPYKSIFVRPLLTLALDDLARRNPDGTHSFVLPYGAWGTFKAPIVRPTHGAVYVAEHGPCVRLVCTRNVFGRAEVPREDVQVLTYSIPNTTMPDPPGGIEVLGALKRRPRHTLAELRKRARLNGIRGLNRATKPEVVRALMGI